MSDSSPLPDGNPYEPPRSNQGVGVEKARPPLRWYHWLAFFSPAVLGTLSVRFGPAGKFFMGSTSSAVDRDWSIVSLMCITGLGVLLCVVIGHWFSRRDDGPNREAIGCGWTICSLIVNAAIILAVGFLVLRR